MYALICIHTPTLHTALAPHEEQEITALMANTHIMHHAAPTCNPRENTDKVVSPDDTFFITYEKVTTLKKTSDIAYAWIWDAKNGSLLELLKHAPGYRIQDIKINAVRKNIYTLLRHCLNIPEFDYAHKKTDAIYVWNTQIPKGKSALKKVLPEDEDDILNIRSIGINVQNNLQVNLFQQKP